MGQCKGGGESLDVWGGVRWLEVWSEHFKAQELPQDWMTG